MKSTRCTFKGFFIIPFGILAMIFLGGSTLVPANQKDDQYCLPGASVSRRNKNKRRVDPGRLADTFVCQFVEIEFEVGIFQVTVSQGFSGRDQIARIGGIFGIQLV